MSRVVITEFMDEAAVKTLTAKLDTHYDPKLANSPRKIPGLLGEATALIVRNRTKVTAKLLDAAPNLQCVGRLGVGLDNIDLEACKERGVAVYPATGANNLAVAEYVIANAMILLRGAYLSTAAMLEGTWPRERLMGRELSGKVMGLVGFGAIAYEVAVRAQLLGMPVLAFDPHRPANDSAWQLARNLSLEAVLEQADVVSLHTPLNDATRHMIDVEAIARMKKGSVLINAARGGIVDEEALAKALLAGKIGGAALDVFETEPLTAEAAAAFADIPNLVLTPHIAGVTDESNVRVSALTAKTVLEHLANHTEKVDG